jgi:hypothetical protein
MATLEFKDLSFKDCKDKIKINFLKIFYFYLNKSLLNKISKFKITQNKIIFENISEKRAERKFNFLLQQGFKNLKNKITNRKTVYIHKNSNIPLIGSVYFGIIDRGTNIIEIRPITGCNLNCIYCSVDEGIPSKRKIDFVVEEDYLIEELKKVIDFKNMYNIEVHINAQGEPLLYADIINLIKDIRKIKAVETISMDTNGTLLTKVLIDELAEAGLTRINLSLNALSQEIAKKMANKPYNLKKVLEIAEYIPKKLDLIIAPVWVPGYNDKEIPKLIEFAKKIGAGKSCPPIGIQNFLNYKFGRNPVKATPLEVFFKKIRDLEKKYNANLTVKEGFKVVKTKELPKPFKRKEVIEAKIVLLGRLKNEKLAIGRNRLISIPNCYKDTIAKIKITRTKHNIFFGEMV